MSTPTTSKPYTPQQVLNNLRTMLDELARHPDTRHADAAAREGPGYVKGRCLDILNRGIEPAEEIIHRLNRYDTLVNALQRIQSLALGPDQGSTGWQAETAHTIATEALDTLLTPLYLNPMPTPDPPVSPSSDLAGTCAELSLYRSSQRIITLTVVTEGQGHIDIEIPEDTFTDLLFGVAASQAPIRRHFPRKRPRPS